MDEAALQAELYTLIRSLYRKKRADAILDAFSASLANQPDADERMNLLAYWLDFYRLRKYQRERQRRRPSLKERVTPCYACGYPSSHRHHLWDFATHGENNVTIQLCANCHELHHLLYNALVKDSDYSRKLALHTMHAGGIERETVRRILGWCAATIRYEAAYGWVDAARASAQHIERVLNWAAYLRGDELAAPEQDERTPTQ